jgi:hypothetical protein
MVAVEFVRRVHDDRRGGVQFADFSKEFRLSLGRKPAPNMLERRIELRCSRIRRFGGEKFAQRFARRLVGDDDRSWLFPAH